MKRIIHVEDVQKLDLQEQLEFYKEQFSESRHCELGGCGHQLYGLWTLYDGEPYCRECFGFQYNEDVIKARKTIKEFESLIEKTKSYYPDINWEEEDES